MSINDCHKLFQVKGHRLLLQYCCVGHWTSVVYPQCIKGRIINKDQPVYMYVFLSVHCFKETNRFFVALSQRNISTSFISPLAQLQKKNLLFCLLGKFLKIIKIFELLNFIESKNHLQGEREGHCRAMRERISC